MRSLENTSVDIMAGPGLAEFPGSFLELGTAALSLVVEEVPVSSVTLGLKGTCYKDGDGILYYD